MDTSSAMISDSSSLKRPRSPTDNAPLPLAKVPRTATNHLQINYLARQQKETIPLVTVNDKLPELARLLGEYDGVLQRHESMAGNLGACPLGPILLKRFERLFDGPPKVLKSHAKDSTISWLDVVEFAQNNPKQFNLERTRNGIRVCQFYTKQCRVEVSEEDYVLIASGMPQKLIPPQPIPEDEEKELAVMDLLDRNLGQIIQLADQVSGRARQMIHKMKNRRTAILARREHEAEAKKQPSDLRASPLSPAETNGNVARPLRSVEVSHSPPAGFMTVNLRQAGHEPESRAAPTTTGETHRGNVEDALSQNLANHNGRIVDEPSPNVRSEMLHKFLTPAEREAGLTEETIRRSSLGTARTTAMQQNSAEKQRSRSTDLAGGVDGGKNPPSVAIPSTPVSLLPQMKPSPMDRDDGGPFKSEMVRRMDNMWKGDRVIPPCDRCRRLHMDCLKNLTACMGCTKKHAKCSWKEVKADELQGISTRHSASPERERAASGPSQDPDPAPPLSANSTIVVFDRHEVAPKPTAEAGARVEEAAKENRAEATQPGRKSEPALGLGTTAKFDVRPPPLGQTAHGAAGRRSSTVPTLYGGQYSPAARGVEEEDDDEGDRLLALAARVYRTASQSGHRM
ncbi:hypothetical protein B0A52_03968 [Exophiala mesophila]|uniref:Zn(2)-C6 fungal-type domain-containing protein n=1 Tax=Exophiala mesophila TaxID=212818 RepID=A0A438NAD1_EXOME|nr:hypothetical protein B0A52_03968 [Exophiala mesophila]